MKKLLLKLALAIAPMAVNAQMKVSVSTPLNVTIDLPDSLAGKGYVQNAIKQAIKDAGLVVQPPVVVDPVKPADCEGGLKITNVLNTKNNGLDLQFHSGNAFKVTVTTFLKGLTKTDTIEPRSNILEIKYPVQAAGKYKIVIRGVNCTGADSAYFTVPNLNTGEVVTPPIPPTPDPVVKGTKGLGAYATSAGGRTYTYTKSPSFSLSFNSDGTISDNTPGIQHGNPSRLNGKYVFYMSGYSVFTDNGAYRPFEHVYLPDGIYTIRQFQCNDKLRNLDSFLAGINGYPQDNGVNEYNATLSEITLTIRTDAKPALPEWVKVSRRVEFPYSAPDRAIGRKVFAIETLNTGDTPALYHSKGVHTGLLYGSNSNQPNTFRCYKWPWDGLPRFSDEQLYNSLRGMAIQYGLTPKSIITDEYPENSQGTDGSINDRMYHAYKGVLDYFRDKEPGLDKRNTGLYGSYGIDDFTGTIGLNNFWWGSRKQVEESLSTKVHYASTVGGTWHSTPASYYASGQIDVRNLNASYYMYNGIKLIPYDLLYTSERVKIGSKTYQGKDRESNFIVFGTNLTQTLVMGNDNTPMGVEESKTGEVIPFPNGEITSQYNVPPAAVVGEYRTLGFWSTLLGDGIAIWGSAGFGTDTTKFHTWDEGQPIYWTRTGGQREKYQPGVNGAPTISHTGMIHTLGSTVTDAAFLGYSEARDLDDYTDKLSFASYTSSKKSFTAVPGKTGLHLNGRGELNIGLLCMHDAVLQKAGVALVGEGKSGKVLIYYNGFLSAQEYEDNVTISGVNIGRVYGRTTAVKKL